jgi:hypothetical protein
MLTTRPRPLTDHPGQHRVVHVQRAVEVDGDDLVPQLDVALEERLHHVPAGIVDENVHRPPALHLGHRLVDRTPVGDVDAMGEGLAAVRGNDADRFGRPFLVDVEDGHFGAFLGEPAADLPPDAASAAGHDDALSLEPSHESAFGCHVEQESNKC